MDKQKSRRVQDAMSNMAIFFDRDGTLIRDPGYIAHPDQVELLAGAAEAVKELQLLGYKIVVVSNQPGVARGILTEEMLEPIHGRLRELLSQKGASLDAIYYCPYHPDGAVPKYRKDSDWRKPKPGMLLAAAEELDIDLTRSWMVGDSHRDIEAGRSAGCKTILISSAYASPEAVGKNKPDHIAVNMREAVNIVKRHHRSGQESRTASVTTTRNEPTPSPSPAERLSPQEEQVPAQQQMQVAAHGDEPMETETTVEQLLETILEQLRRMQKTEAFDEFSLLRLLAGIVQVFVPFCLLMALWLLTISDQPSGNILIALGFGGVLQGMALTLYIMNWRR